MRRGALLGSCLMRGSLCPVGRFSENRIATTRKKRRYEKASGNKPAAVIHALPQRRRKMDAKCWAGLRRSNPEGGKGFFVKEECRAGGDQRLARTRGGGGGGEKRRDAFHGGIMRRVSRQKKDPSG